MWCKYCFESNYCEFVCAKKGFTSLSHYPEIRDARCDECPDYDPSEATPELREAFKKWDKENTKQIEAAEARFWGD